MLMLRRFVVYAFVLGTVAALSAAQPDIASIGPQVGARVPDFTGVDQFGRRHTLQSVVGPNGAMLVFFRSADW
jgi:hypothetical protein